MLPSPCRMKNVLPSLRESKVISGLSREIMNMLYKLTYMYVLSTVTFAIQQKKYTKKKQRFTTKVLRSHRSESDKSQILSEWSGY